MNGMIGLWFSAMVLTASARVAPPLLHPASTTPTAHEQAEPASVPRPQLVLPRDQQASVLDAAGRYNSQGRQAVTTRVYDWQKIDTVATPAAKQAVRQIDVASGEALSAQKKGQKDGTKQAEDAKIAVSGPARFWCRKIDAASAADAKPKNGAAAQPLDNYLCFSALQNSYLQVRMTAP